MDPFQAGTIGLGAIGSATNLAGGLAQSILNWKNNDFNKDVINRQLKLQEDNNEYQKYFSENSAQIRAKDLEKAGLSKTLAAGSSAVNPGLSSNPEPQLQHLSGLEGLGNFSNNLLQAIDLSNTIGVSAYNNDLAASSTQLNYQSEKTQKALESLHKEQEQHTKAQKEYTQSQKNTFDFDSQLYHNLGIPKDFQINNLYTLGMAGAFNTMSLFIQAENYVRDNMSLFGNRGKELLNTLKSQKDNFIKSFKNRLKGKSKDNIHNYSDYNFYDFPN